MSEKMCDRYGTFTASDCPDYGSSDCPRTVPGAKCEVDEKLVAELMAAKARYYERKGGVAMTDSKTAAEHFKAEYEGQGFHTFWHDGWPDYVMMGNGGYFMDGSHESKKYISADIFEAIRLFYERELDARQERILELIAKSKEDGDDR